MDSRALRLGNRLLGNDDRAAALEITLSGPTLKFNCDAQLVVTGAEIDLTLDGEPLENNSVFTVRAGMTLRMGDIRGAGAQLSVPARRVERAGLSGQQAPSPWASLAGTPGAHCVPGMCCTLRHSPLRTVRPIYLALHTRFAPVRELRVIYGPHGAPEYFTPAYVATFFATEWEVHLTQPYRGAPDWPETGVGARKRRRSGAASVEHSR
jgi:urea carboxylase